MNKGQKIAGTFLCFIVIFGGVKQLDAYSANYEHCAHVWSDRVDHASFSPYLSEYVQKQMDEQSLLGLNGEACPALWPGHQARLEARLNITK